MSSDQTTASTPVASPDAPSSESHAKPRRPTPSTQSRRPTRERILTEALRLFSARGFEEASLRDLADAVGIRQPSLYKHFPTQQAILDELLERGVARLQLIAEARNVPFDDPAAARPAYSAISEEGIAELSLAMFDAVLHDDLLAPLRRILIMEQFRSPHAAELLREWFVIGPLRFQEHLFAELIASGSFIPGPDPRQLALEFYAPLHLLLAHADLDPSLELGLRDQLRDHVIAFGRRYSRKESS